MRIFVCFVISTLNVESLSANIEASLADAMPSHGKKQKSRGKTFALDLLHAEIPCFNPRAVGLRSSSISNTVQFSESAFSALVDFTIKHPSHFLALRGFCGQLSSVMDRIADAELFLSVSRARVMLGHWHVWCYLHSTVYAELDVCLLHYRTNTRCSCWLRSLVVYVSGLLAGTTRSTPVCFQKAFPALKTAASRAIPDAVVSKASTNTDPHQQLKDFCLAAFAQWLGLQPTTSSTPTSGKPSPDLWDIRGGVVHYLASMHKPALFLLPEVHHLFSTPVPYGFSALCFVNGAVLPAIVYDQLLYTDERSTLLDSLSDALENIAPDIVNAVASCPVMVAGLQLQAELGRDVFLRLAAGFLRSTRPLLNEELPSNGLCKWITADNDKLNPLREYAKSRSLFRNDSGINSSFLHTRAGLFSVVVFRAITFNSAYLFRYKRAAFRSLDDWEKAIRGVPGKDVCNMRAYGQPISGRSHHLASTYWEKCITWEQWLKKHPTPSFEELHNYIKFLNFSNVGDLLAILITEDLYYGDVCDPPNQCSFAQTVLKMSKGAQDILTHFHVLPNTHTIDSKDNIDAFIDTYHALSESLQLTEDDDLLPDIMVFEHLSCKIDRAWKANKLALK